MRCCASTTRQGLAASGRTLVLHTSFIGVVCSNAGRCRPGCSELAADGVQILDDVDESLDAADAIRGDGSKVAVERRQPSATLCLVAACDGIETAIEPEEQQRQRSFGAA